MFGRSLCCSALVLAATNLAAQTATPSKPQPPPPARPAADRYVPAIMQERSTTIAGCLQKSDGWVLTGATIGDQKEPATYKLEGIADARLALFEGKRIEATGVTQAASLGAPATSVAPAKTTAAAAKRLPVFEATAVREPTPPKDAATAKDAAAAAGKDETAAKDATASKDATAGKETPGGASCS